MPYSLFYFGSAAFYPLVYTSYKAMVKKPFKTINFAQYTYICANMKTIEQILQESDTSKIHTLLTGRKKPFATPFDESERQYDPKKHRIFDENYRPKKTIQVPTGKRDPMTGKPLYRSKKVERVRIAVPCQVTIVDRATGFLVGNPVSYKITQNGVDLKQTSDSQQRLFEAVKRVYHHNKMKYFDKKLCRAVFRAREAAELWYMETTPTGQIDTKGKMRVKLLSPIYGDKLYPHFNDYDRMDGFAREYKVYDETGIAENHFDVYTDLWVFQYVQDGTKWVLKDGVPKQHGFTKIPVVYYRQEHSEWEHVQWAIERVEDCISNWGDTNDYFGTPKYFVKGKLTGFAEKGEQGAVFEGEKDTQMSVLSWDSSPASVTGEIANLFSIIFSYSHSADISFERMKELGNNTSGAAIRLMFTDPHMHAQDKTELFGEMFTRRSNIVANGICHTGIIEAGIPERTAVEVEFEPVFTPYMPKNDQETLQLISTSTGGMSTTSKRRAVELNPLNDDPERVMKEMEEEQQQALALQAQMMGTGGSTNSNNSVISEE